MYKKILLILSLLLVGCDDNIIGPELNEDTIYRSNDIFDEDEFPIPCCVDPPADINLLSISINKENEFYIDQFTWPDSAPYWMEIEVVANTHSNNRKKINWHTNKEYVIHECGDYEECPLIFDLMADSTTYTDNRGISKNTIRISPEFVGETIYIYSNFVDKNDIYYRDILEVLLTW